MCLIAVAHGVADRYRLVVAANRDERHARPTAPAQWWPGPGAILGGRDLVAGGSWLAIDAQGRLAAVTNVFEGRPAAGQRSRGGLVADFLGGDAPAREFCAGLGASAATYGPFNLLLFDAQGLEYASNRAPASPLAAGIHALSNTARGATWPKVEHARAGLAYWLEEDGDADALLAWLGAGRDATTEDPRERLFIRGTDFGTRCSTVVLVGYDGTTQFRERSFDAAGDIVGEVRYEFALGAPGTVSPVAP